MFRQDALKEDMFGGVTLDLAKEKTLSVTEFSSQLERSLEMWKDSGKRGLWIKIPLNRAELVPAAAAEEFEFHHAKPDYVMMTRWLQTGHTNMLPIYPHHQVGVGGMLINSRGEVLGIQEKRGITSGMKDFWKLPGGLVDPTEDIRSAAEREVLEETGIQSNFVSIAAFRETHNGPFGCTDLYLICCMKLDESYGDEIPTPVPQEEEIANTSWKPLDQFLGSQFYAKGLYGAMLRTAAESALKVATGESLTDIGLCESRMKGLGGKMESMYHYGTAKL